MGIAFQSLLNLKRKTLHPAPHVRMARRDPNSRAAGNGDHDRSAFNAATINGSLADALMLTRTPSAKSTTIAGSRRSSAFSTSGSSALTTARRKRGLFSWRFPFLATCTQARSTLRIAEPPRRSPHLEQRLRPESFAARHQTTVVGVPNLSAIWNGPCETLKRALASNLKSDLSARSGISERRPPPKGYRYSVPGLFAQTGHTWYGRGYWGSCALRSNPSHGGTSWYSQLALIALRGVSNAARRFGEPSQRKSMRREPRSRDRVPERGVSFRATSASRFCRGVRSPQLAI